MFFPTPTRAWVVAADLDRPYWLRRVQRFLQIRNILGVREANDVVPSMLCTNVGDVPTSLFASYANDDGLFFASELGHCLPAFRTPDRHRRTPRSLPRHRTKASSIRRFVELNSCRGVWLGSPICSKQRASGARSTGPTSVTPVMDRAPTCRHSTPPLAQRSACAVPVSLLDPTCSRGGSVTCGVPTCRGCAEGSAPRCLRTTLANQTGFLAALRRHSRTINRCTQPGNLGTQPASWQGLPARRR